jgi:recombinational DNA repair protein RecT
MSNTEQNQVALYEPQKVRSEVINQMESMAASKFVSLPESYREGVFFAMEKLSTLDGIENVPSISVTKAFLRMFSNKLDYSKNHCYFFVQNDKTSPTGKSLRFGWQYQGLMFVAKNICEVNDVIPVLINENDEFEMHYENGILIIDKHNPTFEGNIIGGYCIVSMKDKGVNARYYTRAQLDQRRDKSQSKNGNFWAWEREMFEKTLVNATLKRVIETHCDTDKEDLYAEPETIDVAHREVVDQKVIEQKDPKKEIEKVEI